MTSIGEFGLSLAKKKEQPRLRHGCSEREKIRLIGDPSYFMVLGNSASLRAAIAPSGLNLLGSMVHVAVLLGKSTLTSVTPSKPASVSRTASPQTVAHDMPLTSNDT